MTLMKYIACQCGLHRDLTDSENADALLFDHISECPIAQPRILLPMWSIAWPWYWGVKDGIVAADYFGLEMAWRPVGSDSPYREISTGGDPKAWHLFTSTTSAERSPKDPNSLPPTSTEDT